MQKHSVAPMSHASGVGGPKGEAWVFEGTRIRHIVIDGCPWLLLPDVLRSLGYRIDKGVWNYTRHIPKDEMRVFTKDDVPSIRSASATGISKQGLTRLLMRSDRPAAVRFQDWLIYVVLPAYEGMQQEAPAAAPQAQLPLAAPPRPARSEKALSAPTAAAVTLRRCYRNGQTPYRHRQTHCAI